MNLLNCARYIFQLLGTNKLSGYYDSQKGGFHDLGTHTTGDTDNEVIRREMQ